MMEDFWLAYGGYDWLPLNPSMPHMRSHLRRDQFKENANIKKRPIVCHKRMYLLHKYLHHTILLVTF